MPNGINSNGAIAIIKKYGNIMSVGGWVGVTILGGVLLQFAIRDRNLLQDRVVVLEATSGVRGEIVMTLQQGITRNNERLNEIKDNIAENLREIKEQLKEMTSDIKLLRAKN